MRYFNTESYTFKVDLVSIFTIKESQSVKDQFQLITKNKLSFPEEKTIDA